MKYGIKNHGSRYFVGIEYPGGVKIGVKNKIRKYWSDFFDKDFPNIDDVKDGGKFIGLECYPPDFMKTKQFDYFILCEVNKIYNQEGFISKKLPEGKYACFPIAFDNILSEIPRVYEFIKENDIKINHGFDYEDYLQEEDYTKSGAVLNFCVKLVDDNE